MIFKKDPKLKYTDMCIYIDNHIYSGDYDPELVYQYLYFLVYMLSSKRKYFTKISEYEDFSLWCARRIYIKLTIPKKETPSGRNRPVKSILNWLKKSLWFQLCYYRQENFQETIQGDYYSLGNYYSSSLESNNNTIIISKMMDLFSEIPSMLKRELNKSPYKSNPVYYNRVYISCLLNLIYEITPSNTSVDKLEKKMERDLNTTIVDIKDKDKKEEILLWGLENNLAPYIKMLNRNIKKELESEIKDIMKLRYTEEEKQDLIMSGYSDANLSSLEEY